MDPSTAARYAARSRLVKAMAHPTRLFLVDELAKGERCVCELTALVGADVSTVSKHLSLMKAAGIVADDKRGTQVFYRLAMPCVLRFLDCVDTLARENAQAQMRVLG